MSHFIKVTHEHGDPLLVNLDQVKSFRTLDGGTYMELTSAGGDRIRESLEDIHKLLHILKLSTATTVWSS